MAVSAYKARFKSMIDSYLTEAVWKNWEPLKHKLFAWHIFAKPGMEEFWCLPIMQSDPKSTAHLFFKWLLNLLISWHGIDFVDTSTWDTFDSVEEWWLHFIYVNNTRMKSFASLLMLTSWVIWTELNAGIFGKFSSLSSIVVAKIKGEAAL
jgi:hypothetical protein